MKGCHLKLWAAMWLCIFMHFTVEPIWTQSIHLAQPVDESAWPEELPWWKRNNLRVMQTNLPAYEATLNVDSLIADLNRFSVNTLIINGGGIMAFYPTQLDFQYVNPYMQPHMLSKVVERCHQSDIRVITRFDFSRVHRTIFAEHPDWCYISPTGERIINDDMYLASINAPYVQEKSIEIIEEVMDQFPIDGIFINMPGYHTRNVYEGTYHGIDQNKYDQERFSAFSGGHSLPLKEDINDPVFRKYQEFKSYTADAWMANIHQAVKANNPAIAICTYQEEYVDIIRHESQTNSLPYWPYMSYDNVTNTMHSQPDRIVSNASIQQISFRSRYNAIEPEETTIRLYENLAAGSGLDMSLMGDFRNYEDERNFATWEEIYAFHKKHEPYYGRYSSPAEICIISPGYWPSGQSGQEYRGIQLMLKEAHLQYDIVEYRQVGHLQEKLHNYKVIILPTIAEMDSLALSTLLNACQKGTILIGTNQTLIRNPTDQLKVFGARLDTLITEGHGHYLAPDNKSVFTRFAAQRILFSKFNLGFYDFMGCDEKLMPIYTPGRPGPPEKIGGHVPTGYYGVGIKQHGLGKSAFIPVNIGRMYYLHGYEQHKNILLDVLEYLQPQVFDLIQTNAHPRLELVLQHFILNTPQKLSQVESDGMILHAINLTGFSGNTYFEPLRIEQISAHIRCDFTPSRVFTLRGQELISFNYQDGFIQLELEDIDAYEALIIEK